MIKKSIFGLFVLLFLLQLCFYSVSHSAQRTPSPRIGVWITVFSPDKVLYSKENVDRLIHTCKKAGIDDIYLQVYRANKAYYNSGLTDKNPYEQMGSTKNEDTLKYLLKTASKNKLKVHAWLNLLSLAQNQSASILEKYGPDILCIDQHGRTSMPEPEKDQLDNYYIRENQIFLEPGHPKVKQYLQEIVKEIITQYPEFSGLHLDYIRYPSSIPFIPGSRFTSHGLSYGYSKTNIELFKKATGLDPNTMKYSRQNFKSWDDWKRTQITSLLADISQTARRINSSIEISCTIVPSIERTYSTTFQNWTEWLKQGYADYVVAMNYTDDLKLFKITTDSLLLPEFSKKVQIGVGAYLLTDDTKQIETQINYLKQNSVPGIVLFSYDDITKNSDLQNFLKDNFK
ncbi:MAG: family 10 glycosylhydrolase [Candidatus Omnitrophica bacterium]|nr:family 10 glycosylhydrolase [Candidatus Omnitrophota bacterium]MBU1894495.1 family 10 glycosylhydrolase [Candidatus Omnitrophota bacterium]